MSSIVVIGELVASAAAIALLVYAKWRDPRRRARRAFKDLPDTPISAIEDGERVRITGIVAVRAEQLLSPVSQRPCIGYRVVVKGRSTRVGNDIEMVLEREDCKAFWIADESGRALVEGPFVLGLDADEAGWSNLPPTVYQMLDDANVAISGSFGGDREFRYTEARLAPGDRIAVVGRASSVLDPAGETRGHRRPPKLWRITGTKSEPVMIADVDEPASEV